MKRVFVNEKWCLGCHLCEYNCAYANSGIKDMVKALKSKEIRPRIRKVSGMEHYVIMGRGTAAIGCVEGIRSMDKDGKITVISAERYPAYLHNSVKSFDGNTAVMQSMIKIPNLSLYDAETRRNSLESVI